MTLVRELQKERKAWGRWYESVYWLATVVRGDDSGVDNDDGGGGGDDGNEVMQGETAERAMRCDAM